MVQAKGQSIFHAIHKVILTDAQVTRPNLESAFARIKAVAKPNDAFIFYYSGHGAMPPGDSSDWYLICQDVVQLEGPQGIVAKGMSAHELKSLSTQVPALKKLLVLDACQSGGALDAFQSKGLAEETAIAQLSHSTGTVILAASLKAQSAQVIESLKHSVFTYALLQGLSGEADRPTDGKVTVKKLDSYLTNQLPLLTQKYGGQAQYPTSCAFGQDFPLGVH